jgi:hypothetical protein
MATFVSGTATAIKATSSGAASAGAISIPGLQVGDVLVAVLPAGFVEGVEEVVTVADQLQQTANLDWSSVNFTFYLLRGV